MTTNTTTSPTTDTTTPSTRPFGNERGGATIIALLVLGLLATGLYLRSAGAVEVHLPAWLGRGTVHLSHQPVPTTSTTSPAGTDADGVDDPEVGLPFLRAGRHDGFDRIVLDAAGACAIDDAATSYDSDGSWWLRVTCDQRLDDLVIVPSRPVAVGLEDVLGWAVDPRHGDLLVHVAAGATSLGCDDACDRTAVFDIADPA